MTREQLMQSIAEMSSKMEVLLELATRPDTFVEKPQPIPDAVKHSPNLSRHEVQLKVDAMLGTLGPIDKFGFKKKHGMLTVSIRFEKGQVDKRTGKKRQDRYRLWVYDYTAYNPKRNGPLTGSKQFDTREEARCAALYLNERCNYVVWEDEDA